jgi:hypothetical protein
VFGTPRVGSAESLTQRVIAHSDIPQCSIVSITRLCRIALETASCFADKRGKQTMLTSVIAVQFAYQEK